MADAPDDSEKPVGPTVETVPEGDDRVRLVCPDCGYIRYDNPKIVVGSVAFAGDRVLMCRRSIQPRRGFWTLPAGYLELNESPEEGAAREAWEEARAKIRIDALLAIYHIPRISQVQLFYRAVLLDKAVSAGPESEEVALFRWDEIPWEGIAFPSVAWALNDRRDVGETPLFAPRTNPPGDLGEM